MQIDYLSHEPYAFIQLLMLVKMGNNQEYGSLIFYENKLIRSDENATQFAFRSGKSLQDLSLSDFLEWIHPHDRNRVQDLIYKASRGFSISPELDICIQGLDSSSLWLDMLASQVKCEETQALQIILIDKTLPRLEAEKYKGHLRRLSILREIELSIHFFQDEKSAASSILKEIRELLPDVLISILLQIAPANEEIRLLAFDSLLPTLNIEIPERIIFTETRLGFDRLGDGKVVRMDDLQGTDEQFPIESFLIKAGMASSLNIPLRWKGKLIGALILGTNSHDIFTPDYIQSIQDVADSLAVSMQLILLRQTELRSLRETEAMRDIMAELANAGNLKQTLEIILVNLHNVLHYDVAGLFLLEENDRYINLEKGEASKEGNVKTFKEDDPLVVEMRSSGKPLVIADVQSDPRFSEWQNMQSVRGWLGAPLLVGADLIGFLSLGSLQTGAYNQEDADLMLAFASQVANVLENVWINEQSHRRTEELEVLTNITFALEQAESGENTLFAITEQIAQFYNATEGACLFLDRSESNLVVNVSRNLALKELVLPIGDDIVWRAFKDGQTRVLTKSQLFRTSEPPIFYEELFSGVNTAVFLPIKTRETTFGVLCLTFEKQRNFSKDELRLFDAVGDIAGASLHRALALEALAQQVDVRTQHLTTLYDINTASNELRELEWILGQILDITLNALNCQMGAVHFLDEKGIELYLMAQRNLPNEFEEDFVRFPLSEIFWNDLLDSTNPIVITDVGIQPNLPASLSGVIQNEDLAYIGAPIRAKGQVLGLLSIFTDSALNYSIDDITLFMTIGDQIGASIERSRLMRQAELAAIVQERQRLARELHDSVTQLLYGQVLFSSASMRVLRQGDLDTTRQHIMRIDTAAQQALREMRLLVYQLRPSEYLGEGLESALEHRLESVEKRAGMNAQIIIDGEINLDEDLELDLFRIIEEALNNTLKHAAASSVIVKLVAQNGLIRLEIEDDGKGFDPSKARKGGGFGLKTMQERAIRINSELKIISAPHKGTRILVEFEEP